MKFTLFLLSTFFINQCLSQQFPAADPSAAAPAAGAPAPAAGAPAPAAGAPAPAPPGPGPIVSPALPPSLLPAPVPLQLNPFVGAGPLGLGPAGLGPFGLFGPLGGLMGPLGLRGFGANPLWRNPIGRRSVEETSTQNRTTCSYVSTESIIRCVGAEHIECPVEARLEEIRNITVRLPVLNLIPEIIKTKEGKEADILRLVSRTTGSRWTLIHPKTNEEVLMSIYSSPDIAEPGFMVKDNKCMGRIESLVSPLGVEGARFSLVVRA